MLARLSAKGWLALAAAVIAATFVALLVTSRGPTEEELEREERVAKLQLEEQAIVDNMACRDAVDHAVTAAADYLVARYGDGAADAIREIVRHRCEADAWPASAIRCLEGVKSDNALQRCIGELADHQRRAVEAEMKAFALRPPPPPPPDAPVEASDDLWAPLPDRSDVPYACQEYERLVAKVMVCDKLPAATREAMKQALDTMKGSWKDLATLPPEARDAVGMSCQAGVDALNQAIASICGW